MTLSLMALACLTMQAQDTKNFTVLAKSQGIWTLRPQAEVDKKTKKKTVTWESTENNSWHEDVGFVSNVPVTTVFKELFDDMPQIHSSDVVSPTPWLLAEEGDETVLHCYFQMPADIVKNLWLASDECVILDKETGVIYQSRRTVPAECYDHVFSVKGKEGTMFDFQIFFPKLPESTHEIAIYGVPAWHMRGTDATIARPLNIFMGKAFYWDEMMPIHKAHLVSEAKDYNKDHHWSWAVYDDVHLIKPTEKDTYAIWRTPEATYLAMSCEKNWKREYFGLLAGNMLIDQYGHQYKLKEVLGFPDGPLFWVEGYPGDYFAIVQVFEPIPVDLETITYIDQEDEPFAAWGANWKGEVKSFNIQELRDNQKLFKYHPRQVEK